MTGIPSHKDRVILAIFMAAKVRGGDDVLEKFRKKLGSREKLVNELDKYAVSVIKAEEKKPT